MIVALFRSRLKAAEPTEEYLERAKHLSQIVATMPGYVSHKGFVAPDGERLTCVEFESEEALQSWSIHPEHRQAKMLGRKQYYAEYRVQICAVTSDWKFDDTARR